MGYTSTEKLEDKFKKIKRLERFQNRQSLNTHKTRRETLCLALCNALYVFFKVMADRGFLIKEELISRGANSGFHKRKNQLKGTEVISSRKIANLRIHVS